MATLSFQLATVGREAPLYLATPTNALAASSFTAHVGDQFVVVDQAQSKVGPTGAGLFVPVSPADPSSTSAGQTFWIEQGALQGGGASSGSATSMLPLLLVGGLLLYLYFDGDL